MGEEYIVVVFVIGLGAVFLLGVFGVNAAVKEEAKKRKDKSIKEVDKQLVGLTKDLKKLRSNKAKAIQAVSKDIKKLRDKTDKLDKRNGLNLGQIEKLELIKFRLSLLESRLE